MPLPYYREVFTEHEKGEPLTLLFLQVSLELLDWISALQGVVIHPDIMCLLHLLGFFHGRQFHDETLACQFLILGLRTNVRSKHSQARWRVNGSYGCLHLVDILTSRARSAKCLVSDIPLVNALWLKRAEEMDSNKPVLPSMPGAEGVLLCNPKDRAFPFVFQRHDVFTFNGKSDREHTTVFRPIFMLYYFHFIAQTLYLFYHLFCDEHYHPAALHRSAT